MGVEGTSHRRLLTCKKLLNDLARALEVRATPRHKKARVGSGRATGINHRCRAGTSILVSGSDNTHIKASLCTIPVLSSKKHRNVGLRACLSTSPNIECVLLFLGTVHSLSTAGVVSHARTANRFDRLTFGDACYGVSWSVL